MHSIHGNQQSNIFNQINATCCVCHYGFNNSNIKIGSRSVMFKDWYKKGVKVIGDLMDSN